jgi:Glycosyltransferase family 87
MPGRGEARAMSLMAVTAAVIVCGISISRGFHGQAFMGRPLGGDFVEFYTIGTILNNFDAARIYDLKLAVDLQHSILPSMAETQMLVYGQAPYIALLFKPFALLPYLWAYVAWLGFSAALYLTGIALLFRAIALPAEHRTIGFLLAVSFMPFIFETWIGGQLSVVIFFLWTLFFCFRRQNRLFLAGLAVALGIFKPTLVALPLAMLIIGRRWRIVQGFVIGAAAVAALSMRMVGLNGCRAWVDTLLFNARVASGPGEAWHLAKSVDVSSFLHLLLFNASPLTGMAVVALAMVAFVLLGRAWWQSSRCVPAPTSENWLWAATLCLTLVVNSYAPIYDTILLVPAAALAAGAMARGSGEEQEAFRGWLLLLYMTAWITQPMAEFLHLQVYTLVLAGFSVWALKMTYATALINNDLAADRNLRTGCYMHVQ